MKNRINVIPYSANLIKLADFFHSGNQYLDSFLKSPLSLDYSIGKTYVFLTEENDKIIGYYNIGVGDIEYLDGCNRIKMGGAAHINCFALDEAYHNVLQHPLNTEITIKLSDVLLAECINRIDDIRHKYIGFEFITLNSTKEGLNLYRRNDFVEIENDIEFSREESDLECIPMYFAFDSDL